MPGERQKMWNAIMLYKGVFLCPLMKQTLWEWKPLPVMWGAAKAFKYNKLN